MKGTKDLINTNDKDKILWALNKRISKNLNKLLEYEKISYSQIIRQMEQTEAYSISASYFSKLLNHPDKHNIPIIFLMQISDLFHITIDDLLQEDFQPEKKKESNKNSKLLDTWSCIADYDIHSKSNEKPKELVQETFNDNSPFISNPDNILFKSVLQPYHVYFYPTNSKENQSIDSLLKGTITFQKVNGTCKVTLKIYANKKDSENKHIEKTYEGYAIISTTVNNLHCILKSEQIGEYCFMIFRLFHLNFNYQDCHIAEILSTSSAMKERYPTVLRMFLSKEAIKEEHLSLVAPHLWLNYSQITISSRELESLKELSEEYGNIIERIISKFHSEDMYIFKEKDAVSIAQDFLSKTNIIKFITELRSKSYAFHYNKASDTANENIRELLKSLGYYKE